MGMKDIFIGHVIKWYPKAFSSKTFTRNYGEENIYLIRRFGV